MTHNLYVDRNNADFVTPVPYLMIEDFLSPALVVSDLVTTSRKKLFESFATLICEQYGSKLEFEEVLKTLNDRERLGSTGIGKGIALPHGRIGGLDKPIISIARLEQSIAYDTPDNEPVWLAVCLLVPADENQVHLQLLSKLAAGFQDDHFVAQVNQAPTASALFTLFRDI